MVPYSLCWILAPFGLLHSWNGQTSIGSHSLDLPFPVSHCHFVSCWGREEGKLEKISSSHFLQSPPFSAPFPSASTRLSSPQDRVWICEELCRAGKQTSSQTGYATGRKTLSKEQADSVYLAGCCAWWSFLCFAEIQNSKTLGKSTQLVVWMLPQRTYFSVLFQSGLPSRSCFSLQAHNTDARLLLFSQPLLYNSSFTSVVLSGTLHLNHAVIKS